MSSYSPALVSHEAVLEQKSNALKLCVRWMEGQVPQQSCGSDIPRGMVSGGGVFGRRLGFDEVEGGALLNGVSALMRVRESLPNTELLPQTCTDAQRFMASYSAFHHVRRQ